MAVTNVTFLAAYPEFSNLGTAQIDAVIAEQELAVADSWDTERDDIVELKVADRLATSPQGRSARLSDPNNATTYAMQLRKREKIHACLLSRVL